MNKPTVISVPSLRPREKLAAYGVKALTDIELLMTIIGSGNKFNSVDQIADSLLPIVKFPEALEISDVANVPGVSTANASRLLAALELGRRQQLSKLIQLNEPEQILAITCDYHASRQEHLICLTLDGAMRLQTRRLITIGTLGSTLVHPREVFAPAIQDRAAYVVIVHNHPSGICTPSEEDRQITQLLSGAGKIVGIELYDHLIVTPDHQYFSFRESGELTT